MASLDFARLPVQTYHRRTVSKKPSDEKPKPDHALRMSILLVLLLLALRIPYFNHPHPVQAPDESLFLAGLGFPADYPVHAPGYPLWIELGTVLHSAGLDGYAAFQVWSVLASLSAPLLLYIGLRRAMDDRLAWWLGFAFGVSPLVWFQSTAALTYLPAATLGLLVAGYCHRAVVDIQARSLVFAVIVLAVGLFLRLEMLIYLGPFVLYTAWRVRTRAGLVAVAILVAGTAAAYALTLYLYSRGEGGAQRLGHAREVILGTSVFRLGVVDGLLRNLVKIFVNATWDFGLAAPLLPWAIWTLARSRGRLGDAPSLLAMWLVPGLLFLLLLHVVQGYFMLLLPAGYALIGLALCVKLPTPAAVRLVAAVALFSMVQFLFYPWSESSTGFKSHSRRQDRLPIRPGPPPHRPPKRDPPIRRLLAHDQSLSLIRTSRRDAKDAEPKNQNRQQPERISASDGL